MTNKNSKTSQTVLSEDRLYSAWDRIVCGRIACAGSTAVHTGHTIGGADVTPFTAQDATECRAAGFEPRCECGAVEATPETTSDRKATPEPPLGTVAWIANPSDDDATWLAQWNGTHWMGSYRLDGTNDAVTNARTRIIRIL